MLKFLDTIFFFKTKEVYSIFFFLLIFLAVKKERLRKKKQISTKKIP